MTENTNLSGIRFIRIDEVSRQTSLAHSTILAWEATGKFPVAIRLSKTLRVWLASDVDSWILGLHSKQKSQEA